MTTVIPGFWLKDVVLPPLSAQLLILLGGEREKKKPRVLTIDFFFLDHMFS